MRAKPGARVERITRRGAAVEVAVREPAVDGRANDAVRRAVAEWLAIAPSRVILAAGAGARIKRLEISGIDETALATAVAALPGDG